MSLNEFFASFLRQSAHASAWLLGWMCLSERLAPGSVLPYFNLYLWSIGVLLLILIAPRLEHPPRWRVLAFTPDAFLLLAFLFLVTKDLGRWGYLLTLSAFILMIAVFWFMSHPETEQAL